MNKIKILLVDDDEQYRGAERAFFQNEGYEVYEASNEKEATRVSSEQSLQVALIDIVIPSDEGEQLDHEASVGIRFAKTLKKVQPECAVILFSAHHNRKDEFIDMVKDGGNGLGYALKGQSTDSLLNMIKTVTAGCIVIDRDVKSKPSAADEAMAKLSESERPYVLNILEILDSHNDLTAREKDVLDLLAQSLSPEGIKKELGLARVDNLISSIYEKLGISLVPAEFRNASILAKACLIKDLRK